MHTVKKECEFLNKVRFRKNANFQGLFRLCAKRDGLTFGRNWLGRISAHAKNRGQSPFPRVKSVSQPRFGLPFDEFLDRLGDLVPEDVSHRRFRGFASERFQRDGVYVVERLSDVFARVFVDVSLLREIAPQLPVYVLDASLLVADVWVAKVDRSPLFPGFGGEFDRLEVGEAGVVVRENERERLGKGGRERRNRPQEAKQGQIREKAKDNRRGEKQKEMIKVSTKRWLLQYLLTFRSSLNCNLSLKCFL